jgi:hypothetical protein
MAGKSAYIEIACPVMTSTPYKEIKNKTTSKQYATLVF